MDPVTAQQRVTAALDAVDAAYAVVRATSTALVGADFRVEVAVRLEAQERANRGLAVRMVGEIVDPPDGPP
ncbi:MAG: HNH nuclease, partial [Mycobacterium sp.]